MHFLKAKQAYSLIELLLVISILALLAVVYITDLQKNAEQKKIDLTVKEIQTLLQAGNTYYLKYGHFYTAVDTNYWSSAFTAPMRPFAPVETLDPPPQIQNPWGYLYQFQGYVPGVADSPHNFGIRAQVPNAQIAQRIAQRLPFANFDSTKNTVTAYIPIPGQENYSAAGTLYKIYDIGQKPSNNFTVQVICPKGWFARVLPFIGGFTPDIVPSQGTKLLYRVWTLDLSASAPDANGNIRVQTIFTGRGASGNATTNMTQTPVLVNYIAYCKTTNN